MATRTAAATGNWSNPATWDGGVLAPLPGDTIVIASPYTVTVDTDISGVNAMLKVTVNSGATLIVQNNLQTTQITADSLSILGTLRHDSNKITVGNAASSAATMSVGTAGKYQCLAANIIGNCELYIYGKCTTTGSGEWEVSPRGTDYTHIRRHYLSASSINSFAGKKFIQKGKLKTAIAPLAADLSVGATAFTVPTPTGWAAGDEVWIGEFSNTAAKMTAYTIASVGTTSGGNTTYNITGSIAVAAVSAVDHKWGQYVINRSQSVKVENTYLKTDNTFDFSLYDAISHSVSSPVFDCENILYDHCGDSSQAVSLNPSQTSTSITAKDVIFEYTRATAGGGSRIRSGLTLAGTLSPTITPTVSIDNLIGVGINYVLYSSPEFAVASEKIGAIYGFFVTNGSASALYFNNGVKACFSKVVLVGNSKSTNVNIRVASSSIGGQPSLSDYVFEEVVVMCGGSSSAPLDTSGATGATATLTENWVDNWAGKYQLQNGYFYFCTRGPKIRKGKTVESLGCDAGLWGGEVDSLTVGQFNADGISVNSGPAIYDPAELSQYTKVRSLTTTGTFTGNKVQYPATSYNNDLLVTDYSFSGSHGIAAPVSVSQAMESFIVGARGSAAYRIPKAKFKRLNGVDAGYESSSSGVINKLTYSSVTPHSLATDGWLFDPAFQYKVSSGRPLVLAVSMFCSAGANVINFRLAKSAAGFDGKVRILKGLYADFANTDDGSLLDISGASLALYDGSDTGWTSQDITITPSIAGMENFFIMVWDGASSGSVYVCPTAKAISYIDGGPGMLMASGGGGIIHGFGMGGGING